MGSANGEELMLMQCRRHLCSGRIETAAVHTKPPSVNGTMAAPGAATLADTQHSPAAARGCRDRRTQHHTPGWEPEVGVVPQPLPTPPRVLIFSVIPIIREGNGEGADSVRPRGRGCGLGLLCWALALQPSAAFPGTRGCQAGK